MKRFLLKQFKGEEGYYIFVRSAEGAEKAGDTGCRVLLWDEKDSIRIIPSNGRFRINEHEAAELKSLSDWDVLGINRFNMATVCYSNMASDNPIVVTLACNSNCIMCPLAERERAGSTVIPVEILLEYAKYIPDDAPYLTITGGEPFLLGKDMFKLLSFLKEKFVRTEFLLLTNGRIFANTEYTRLFHCTHPDHVVTGIPLHGSNRETHDYITQAKGSFEQTMLGIHHLLSYGEKVEIRYVVSKLNEDDITKMSQLIVREIPDIDSVKVMGLEMLGNAALNCDRVWIDYTRAFEKSMRGIDILLSHGINVELYNFPLCCVRREYWALYRKSISDGKVQYLADCSACMEKETCGGIFAGTKRLVKKVWPIVHE